MCPSWWQLENSYIASSNYSHDGVLLLSALSGLYLPSSVHTLWGGLCIRLFTVYMYTWCALHAESATESCPAESAKAYNAIAGALKLKPGTSGVEGSLDVGKKLIERAANSTTYSEGAPLGAI